MDPELTRDALSMLLHEHTALNRCAAKLIADGAIGDAEYVCLIMQTDLAELEEVPIGVSWLRPGEPAPLGWHIYEAALRWCHGGFQGYPDW
jgi:hypothetical protein